jgi:ubiquinone/menaquinone biosynthesis C-methylase UbiE
MAGTGIVGRAMRTSSPRIRVTFQDKSRLMLASDSYAGEDVIHSDACDIPVSAKSFDIVTCRAGLNNVVQEHYEGIIREYLRIVKDDGVVLIQDHFARTEAEKEVINTVESKIALIEGCIEKRYVPTIQELRQMIESMGGLIADEQLYEMKLSMKERFAAKGIAHTLIRSIKEVLEDPAIQFEERDDDVILIYPVWSVAVGTNHATLKKMQYF